MNIIKILNKTVLFFDVSTSNHEPFEFPDGRINFTNNLKNTVHNAMKYADFSIGKFFRISQKEAYFKNTIFVVVPIIILERMVKFSSVNKFHIPALIIKNQMLKRNYLR